MPDLQFDNALQLAGWIWTLPPFSSVVMDGDVGREIAAAIDVYAANANPNQKETTMHESHDDQSPVMGECDQKANLDTPRGRIEAQYRMTQQRDSDVDRLVRDAVLVIGDLESENTALRNTVEFMRDRVRAAIEPR